ncbi:hypothetical protein D6D01_03584 [Aureobasidium pullulans]|uniref:Uncharacterized protein n=1 Tax=Aureobasidium pullulans TaxID=5580 RepID=A0A4S9LK26_AURPU|nr:hypothetical protein D6D01_03584 [Aureobasidium pullulans]
MYSLHTVVGLIAVDPCSIACYRPFVQPIQGAHVLPFSFKKERKSLWLQRASGRLLGSQVLADALHRDRNCYEILDLLRLSVSLGTPPSKGGILHPPTWSAAKFRETKNFANETKLAVDMGCHPWGCRSSTALLGFESQPNVRCCIDTFLGLDSVKHPHSLCIGVYCARTFTTVTARMINGMASFCRMIQEPCTALSSAHSRGTCRDYNGHLGALPRDKRYKPYD